MIAFALTADYAGSVTVDRGAGPETIPKFGGGLLAAHDGDFHVRDTLDAGDGVIVLHDEDTALAELLDAYPALERVPVPKGAVPLSHFARRTTDQLRELAERLELKPHGGVARAGREKLLEALDDDWERTRASMAGEPDPSATAAADGSAPVDAGDGSDDESKE